MQHGLLPKHLTSFGSSCYFPAALLLLLSLDLCKHVPVAIAQRGIVFPSLARGKSWGSCDPHLKGPHCWFTWSQPAPLPDRPFFQLPLEQLVGTL